MPSSEDYNACLAEILAIETKNVMTPNIPIDVFVQESENLYHWCLPDRSALTGAGLAAGLIDNLPVRSGACREAQSLWVKERNTRQESEQQWKDEAPAAFDLRDELVHAFRYAFRNNPVLLARVDEIAQGDTNADMVQDLNDLSKLGKANLALITAVGVAPEKLDQAADTSDRMGDLLGAVNGERETDNEAMVIRDKAFTFLKQAVDEIRNCGKYVFWRSPDRLKGYNSDYWKVRNASTRGKDTTAPES